MSISAPVAANSEVPAAPKQASPLRNAANAQVLGPSNLHSPALADSPSTAPAPAPSRPQPDANHPFRGTACGSRSTRPTGVR